ncbi:hypothetical protein TRFO_20011 [Tritrichomonas foetus]|uniref:Initiator binding domain-containing protein n=1 Tax=Tritrichomonas foetus TaxID=1144522 RepID=A0A1J4KI42_9EUKA|nr:hypothetical protein TRFO_20011 [Tritrichomonas foetus]|eukprot:OHT10608.1 hypothetical protein TRFO_20011 [Tritrichomonas foetus]
MQQELDTISQGILSADDYEHFLLLKSTLSSHICRNCRNRRIESFNEMLFAINNFVKRNNEDIWKRALMCGALWYNSYLCVNIRQLSKLLEKCKSSINGSFQRCSLVAINDRTKMRSILNDALPFLKNSPEMVKMWSVRYFISQAIDCFRPSCRYLSNKIINTPILDSLMHDYDNIKTQNHECLVQKSKDSFQRWNLSDNYSNNFNNVKKNSEIEINHDISNETVVEKRTFPNSADFIDIFNDEFIFDNINSLFE